MTVSYEAVATERFQTFITIYAIIALPGLLTRAIHPILSNEKVL